MRRLVLAAALICLASASAADPALWAREFPMTDFSRASVPFEEIRSGGPPRDGIPALSGPSFLGVSEESGLDPREPVVAVEIDGAAPRAYPLRYLTWHEIVNDTVEGLPIAVTFCPLCNSALTFDRRVKGRVLSFGVTGKLRHSDMVMYDRETESWWQQALGVGIVGEHMGVELEVLPTWIESWERFRERNPGGLVMAQPEWPRAYGRNPYVGYDGARRPFLYSGEDPPHGILPLARVVRVGDRAWPLERLAAAGEITEAGLTLSWAEGAASALDTGRIGDGRDIGQVRVRDASGQDLPHDVMFAFAFDAFWPEGEWMLGR